MKKIAQSRDGRWDHVFSILMRHEGGFVNDKADPGGATRYGISLRYLKASGIDINLDGCVDLTDIVTMDKDNAKEIYHKNWWLKWGYDKVNDIDITAKICDLSVNMGHIQAHKLVQRAANLFVHPLLIVDGMLGDKSIAAINALCKAGQNSQLLEAIKGQAREFYVSLAAHNPDLNKFLRGWLLRAND